MKLVFVNIMQELQRFDSTAYITQPPVSLALLNAATPKTMETALLDEQADTTTFDGDVFAFSVSTQNAGAVYEHADALRSTGKKVILGGIHITVCPEEAALHADTIVTGEAETIWPGVCDDLLAEKLKARYTGSPTPSSRMTPVDYRFFGNRRYLIPAALFATRGCNRGCTFCVSSRYLGPYRMKPLDILEQEIDQLTKLYPRAFLQFTDDNLLAERKNSIDLLSLLRRKKKRFVTMVTVDQFCDRGLMKDMASSGCLGVAVGVESIDDDNCASVRKYQNVQQPFSDAVSYANECGMQVVPLIMVGLPHDTPERLARTLRYLKQIPCSLFDIRVMRIYPSTPLYTQMLAAGAVVKDWWLEKDSPSTCNHLLPSCLSMHFKHGHFESMQLQQLALQLTSELNSLNYKDMAHIIRVGLKGHGLRCAGTLLYARQRAAGQARMLLGQVEQVMSAKRDTDSLLSVPTLGE